MARTAEGAALTAQHYQGQLQIRARALQGFIQLWPLWTGDSESFQRFATAAMPLIRVHHGFSATLAGGYYRAFRKAEKVGGSPEPRRPDPLKDKAVKGTLLLTAAELTRRAIVAGKSPQAARQTALVRSSGTVARFVLDGGRETILGSVSADRQAKGWARVTAAGPCAFCAMLAGRGPVYGERSADFQAHDHCSCGAEPSYEGSEWPGRAREFKRLYEEHAAGAENPVNELRRVLEGA